MFCSHCGKTIDPSQDKCPNCGQALGASRLSGHTSVQDRIVPPEEEGAAAAHYAPYTKTTYTSEMNAGEDVYSRTAYRPVLKAEEPAVQTEEAKSSEQKQADSVEEQLDAILGEDKSADLDDAQKAALKDLTAVPKDAPTEDEAAQILKQETGVHKKALKPIRKKGISPEVESYIQRMEAMKDKKAAKRNKRKDDTAEDESDADAALENAQAEDSTETAEAAEAEVETEAEEAPVKRRNRKRTSGKARAWVSRLLIIALIVAVIGGGLFFLAYITQPKSQIEGVTNDLFKEGVALMKTRLTDEYRQKIISMYRSETMATDVMAQAQADRAEINALMPNNPQENDQKFIDTLMAIQDAVDDATATDGLNAIAGGDSSLGLDSQSSEKWSIISNYIMRLELATKPSELDIVVNGVADVTATPAPSPTPEPALYMTLSKGSTGQEVKDLQLRLRTLGWFQGNVDGKYGTVTRRAIQYFQQAAGMTVTGIADSDTQELIYSDAAPIKGVESAVEAPAPTPAA